MELEKIAQKDIREYLSSLGINPCRETGMSYVYLSPFRSETVPSFFLWKKNNKWKDFGLDRWGDIIDLVMELHGVDIKEALKILSNGSAIDIPLFEKPEFIPKSGIEIMSVNDISKKEIIEYIQSRAISISLAKIYCRQIEFRFPYGKRPGRMYTGVGMISDSGGIEIRNSFFKVSNSPKNVTTFHGDKKKNILFEGFFDFLSALMWFKKEKFDETVIVLNSLGYLTTLIPLLRDATSNLLYIDDGNAANEKIVRLREAGVPYEDARGVFRGFGDFNEFLVAKNL